MKLKLTDPQRAALGVLANCGEVRGWKFSTRRKPTPVVNYLAAGKLCERGLARRHFSHHWDPYSHSETYTITQAGREALLDG